MPENILLFCAHPDDEVIGVGGTIAKYAKQGKKVIVVIFSKGEMTPFWLQKEHTVKIREKESLKAGKLLGVNKTIFLDIADLKFKAELKRPEIKKRIKEIILKYKPSKIFTHSIDDIYGHDQVNRAVLNIYDGLKYNCDVYAFNIWNPFTMRKRNNPRLLVDISDTFEKKMKAINYFESQTLIMYQLYPFMVLRAFFSGFFFGVKYAESFLKIR